MADLCPDLCLNLHEAHFGRWIFKGYVCDGRETSTSVQNIGKVDLLYVRGANHECFLFHCSDAPYTFYTSPPKVASCEAQSESNRYIVIIKNYKQPNWGGPHGPHPKMEPGLCYFRAPFSYHPTPSTRPLSINTYYLQSFLRPSKYFVNQFSAL